MKAVDDPMPQADARFKDIDRNIWLDESKEC